MRDTLKRLLKLSAGYSLVTLIGPLFTILLTPLYTRVLEPADYFVVDVLLTLSAFLSVAVMLGMDQALNAHFFDGDDAHRRNLVTTAVVQVVVIGIVLGMLVALLSQPIATLLFKDSTRSITVLLLALHVCTAPVYAICAAALRLRMGVRRVNALGLAYLITLVGLNVLLVLGLGMKATGIIAANALANVIGATLGIALLWKPLGGRFQSELAVALRRTGIGIVPGVAGYLLLANADRLLLTQYVTQTQGGLYSIANKLASMLYVVLSAAFSAWMPMALEMGDKPDAPRQYARMAEYFLAAASFLALAIGLFASEIITVFARALYAPAAPLTLVLLVYVGPINWAAGLFSLALYARKQTHWLSVSFGISAAINIGLNLVLNPLLGVWGAVWATVIAGVALMACNYAFARRVMFVDYRWLRLIALGILYAGMVLIALLVPAIMQSIALRLTMLAAFVAALFALRIFFPSQIQLGVNFIRHRLRGDLGGIA